MGLHSYGAHILAGLSKLQNLELSPCGCKNMYAYKEILLSEYHFELCNLVFFYESQKLNLVVESCGHANPRESFNGM
jgi:hypothetical protein